MNIILGLGSNLGDKKSNLDKAIKLIEGNLLDEVIQSAIYESASLLPDNAPQNWNINYYNLVIMGRLKREMSPQELLKKIKNIEEGLGRKPSPRWSPREIDIDILAWGDEVINDENLQIPHYAMLERDFVTVPLNEIASEWVHPITKTKIKAYLK